MHAHQRCASKGCSTRGFCVRRLVLCIGWCPGLEGVSGVDEPASGSIRALSCRLKGATNAPLLHLAAPALSCSGDYVNAGVGRCSLMVGFAGPQICVANWCQKQSLRTAMIRGNGRIGKGTDTKRQG